MIRLPDLHAALLQTSKGQAAQSRFLFSPLQVDCLRRLDQRFQRLLKGEPMFEQDFSSESTQYERDMANLDALQARYCCVAHCCGCAFSFTAVLYRSSAVWHTIFWAPSAPHLLTPAFCRLVCAPQEQYNYVFAGLLNASQLRRNQARIARKGLLTLLKTNTMLQVRCGGVSRGCNAMDVATSQLSGHGLFWSWLVVRGM